MNFTPSIELGISLLSAITVLTLGLLQWRSTTRLQRADALDKIGDAYNDLLDRLNTRIVELESRVNYMELELKKYTNWSARLVKQLIENGIIPVQPPDTGELKAKK
jgi:hypothetical protein